MYKCSVCHYTRSREETVDHIFDLDGRYVLVSGIPCIVCARCGERSFTPEATEQCRALVHNGAKADRFAELEVFDFTQPAPRV